MCLDYASDVPVPSFSMDGDTLAFSSSQNITLGPSSFDPYSLLPESLSNPTLPSLVMDSDPFTLASSPNIALGLSSDSYASLSDTALASPPLPASLSQLYNVNTKLAPYTSLSNTALASPPLAATLSQPYNVDTKLARPLLNVPPLTTSTYGESLPQRSTYSTNANRRNSSHVPRPRNAFIIYRTLFNSFAQQDQKRKKHDRRHQSENARGRTLDPRVISKQAAACWRALTPAEREIYEGLADMEKELHMIKYPDYDYNYNAFNLGQKATKSKSINATPQAAPLADFLPPPQFLALSMPHSSHCLLGELHPITHEAPSTSPLANHYNKTDHDWNFLQTFINDVL